MNELHLFAGAGGGILAGHLLGHRCIGAVENNPFCQQVLLARQRDGSLPEFPIFGDIKTFDARPYRGRADIVAGGFPCQDISIAGNGDGLDGERSGLWREMARIVCEARPSFVFVENSPALTSRGLGVVLGDLAALGFDAQWGVLAAADVGAQHLRERIWIVAHARGFRYRAEEGQVRAGRDGAEPGGAALPNPNGRQPQERRLPGRVGRKSSSGANARDGSGVRNVWPPEPGVGRMANGVAHRVDRLKALGNGQVPRVAAAAFTALAAEHLKQGP